MSEEKQDFILFVVGVALISAFLGLLFYYAEKGTKVNNTTVPSLKIEATKASEQQPLPNPCDLDFVICENEQSSYTILARITEYGWTGQRMANGEWPHIGAVATSDRTIPFGTKVLIDGMTYIVKDRTAYWVHDKFDVPTIDIYSKTPSGLRVIPITIYETTSLDR